MSSLCSTFPICFFSSLLPCHNAFLVHWFEQCIYEYLKPGVTGSHDDGVIQKPLPIALCVTRRPMTPRIFPLPLSLCLSSLEHLLKTVDVSEGKCGGTSATFLVPEVPLGFAEHRRVALCSKFARGLLSALRLGKASRGVFSEPFTYARYPSAHAYRGSGRCEPGACLRTLSRWCILFVPWL